MPAVQPSSLSWPHKAAVKPGEVWGSALKSGPPEGQPEMELRTAPCDGIPGALATGPTCSGRRSAGGQVCAGAGCRLGRGRQGPSEWPPGVWLLKAF